MAEAPKVSRRIVTIDDERSKSVAIADGPAPNRLIDPARPGYSSAQIWVTDATPAQISHAHDALSRMHGIVPPTHGSVCRIITLPPDDGFRGKVGPKEIEAFFRTAGAPNASTYSATAPHPYMQKTRTLDFCLILEGEVTLVLDTEEVALSAGDTVVQRGTNHAWSNRSSRPCTIAISSHDATE
jgi:uncharacterized cupin superfamily protein